ncbi:hypothetical protein FOXYSP1_13435 [Fusarium oxysporum f. sp. phaseoli]
MVSGPRLSFSLFVQLMHSLPSQALPRDRLAGCGEEVLFN